MAAADSARATLRLTRAELGQLAAGRVPAGLRTLARHLEQWLQETPAETLARQARQTPSFTVTAADAYAVDVVRWWADLRARGPDAGKATAVNAARTLAARMERWRQDHA